MSAPHVQNPELQATQGEGQLCTFWESVTTPAGGFEVPLGEIVEAIRMGSYELDQKIAQIRRRIAEGADPKGDEIRGMKKDLPGFNLGRFREGCRKNDQLKGSDSFLFDLDGVLSDKLPNLRERVLAVPGLSLRFTSPTGTGLKFAVRLDREITDPREFSGIYKAMAESLEKTLGVALDHTSDASRVCYFSHDPDIYYHPGVAPVSAPVPVVQEKNPATVSVGGREESSTGGGMATSELPRLAIARLSPERADNYHSWIQTGMCCKAAGLPCSTWETWSQQSVKYKKGECECKWQTFTENGGLGAGSLVAWADEDSPGWRKQIDGRTGTSPQNGMMGGRPPATTMIADAVATTFIDAGVMTLRRYQGAWYRFDGRCYRELPEKDLESRVMGELRKQFPENATKNMQSNVVEHLAASDLGGVPSDWERPCWLTDGRAAGHVLSMVNGLLDVEAAARGEVTAILPHNPQVFVTWGLDYPYDPAATAPKFMKYLEDVQPDLESRRVLQMLAGLGLVPDTGYDVFFILFGEGGCGKSVYLDILTTAIGLRNVCCLPLAKFAEKHSSHLLTENLLNIVGDLPTSDGSLSLSAIEGILKDVCSGGLLSVERKFQSATKAKAIARCIFAANSLPPFADRSTAVWDRLRVVEFPRRFRGTPGEVPGLEKIIIAEELPGVLNWAIAGLRELRTLTRFPDTPTGRRIAEEHRGNCDHEGSFLKETVVASPGGMVYSDNLYQRYRVYCQENGFKPRQSGNFANEVCRRFPDACPDRQSGSNGRKRIWKNIGLMTDLMPM